MKLHEEILIRLGLLPNFGPIKSLELLNRFSADELNLMHSQDFSNLGWQENQIRSWFNLKQKVIISSNQWLEKPSNYLISIYSDFYPPLLDEIYSKPLIIWLQGNPKLLKSSQIAMVGSRNCSRYGQDCTNYLVAQLINTNFTITSGLALGIDGFAHAAALKNKVPTIAVLGSGINNIYPKQHLYLAQEIIANGGAIISEFDLNSAPINYNFPRRNRIISGLSLATVVIEASLKSGSLITARYALEQNREVFAVPGSILSQNNQGCHRLLKQGATLIENLEDILSALAPYAERILNPTQPRTDKVPKHPMLYACIGHIPIDIDSLIENTSLTLDTLLTQLLELELEGLIMQHNGLYQRTL